VCTLPSLLDKLYIFVIYVWYNLIKSAFLKLKKGGEILVGTMSATVAVPSPVLVLVPATRSRR